MGYQLKKHDVDFIVEMLNEWEGKLTWNAVVDTYEKRTGRKTTRQTLDGHERIYTAYKVNKGWVSKNKDIKKPKSLTDAGATITKLDREVAVLTEQVEKYEALFTLWLYNARKKGLSPMDLNLVPPVIDRGRTDGK